MTSIDGIVDEDLTHIELRSSQFSLFRDLIYKETGISLKSNKRDFVESRLRKRLRANNLGSFTDYYNLLTKKDPDGVEMQQMINRVTTNKTHFFRELHHFQYLSEVIFPRFIEEANQNLRRKKLRVWCAASSTGEEPYSLAMTVRDSFGKLPNWDIRILASDIDTSVLNQAEAGKYTEERVADIPGATLSKHFKPGKGSDIGTYTVRPETSKLLTFRKVNLLGNEWPIRTQFDVIFIRNVLIYFDQPTQDVLMRRMAQYLKPDGKLFIGHSESLSSTADTYTRVGKTVYQHKNAAALSLQKELVEQTSLRAPARPAPPREILKKSIVVGEVHASAEPTQVRTTLGSCICACLYDVENKIGGMNHFALPDGASDSRDAASFGVHAMELLINQIMVLGGDRRRLRAKIFGGANILRVDGGEGIGIRNAKFVTDFLMTERIPVVAKHVGGEDGMQVLFETHTGKVKVKLLDRGQAEEADRQLLLSQKAQAPTPMSDVTLF